MAVVCVGFLFVSCEGRRWHELSFHNFTGEVLVFQVEGVQLYAAGAGPQRLAGTIHPGRGARYETLGPIRIQFPVVVQWRTANGARSGNREFLKIPTVTGPTIDKGGTLGIGVMADFDVRIVFVESDAVVSRKIIENALMSQ